MMSNTIGMIYDQINEGILPPSVELEAFNACLLYTSDAADD